MEKLKTLKDLELSDLMVDVSIEEPRIKDRFVNATRLKQEAIKWILYYRKFYSEQLDDYPAKGSECLNGVSQSVIRIIEKAKLNFIKYFFNITDEDLK